MGWLSGTDSVCSSAATSTAKPQQWASFGCQSGLNHWTHVVQKAPKANSLSVGCVQAAATCVHPPVPFQGSLLVEAAFRSCHSPALTPLLQGPREGCVCLRGTVSAP